MDKDTLYYDGNCPICQAEVSSLLKHTKGKLVVKDIHKLDDSHDIPDKVTLLARLHLQAADGQWITGLSANIRAWQNTRFAFLWRILDWPVICWTSNWVYELWLRYRKTQASAHSKQGLKSS